MSPESVKKGMRVRDTATLREGTVVSVGTLHLGVVAVALDPRGYDCSTVWIEVDDLERVIPDAERQR